MELMCQFARPEFMGFTVQGPAKQAIEQKLGAVQSVNDWCYISIYNEKVIDEPLQAAEPFHNGIAQAETCEGMSLIKLKYFENE